MAKLPKSIIRKYGISKKAWAVFRGARKTRKTATRSRKYYKRSYTMARRKRKAYRKSSGGGFFGKASQIVIGAGVAALYEVFVSPMIPLGATIKNIIEFALGLFLAVSGRMPMAVRAGGAALATINAFAFIMPLISGGGGSSGSTWGD